MDAFNYLSVMVSMVLGLGLTQLFAGIGNMVQVRRRVCFYWLHSLWVVLMIGLHIQMWWSFWMMRGVQEWTYTGFAFVLLGPATLVIASHVLLPELEKIIQKEFAGREVIQPVSASSPANTSPFAFEGFCLVSILDSQKLRRGNGEFTATYKDQTVCFCSDAHRKTFLANPTRYWPVANGKCLVTESENHQETVGDPRLGVTWRGRLWLFTDRASQKRFIQSPRKYISSGM